jgi:hypothetical protein
MKLTLIITACLIGAGIAGAQEKRPDLGFTGSISEADAKLKPPAITPELREIYQQARADLAEAQLAIVQAQAKLEAAVKAMQSVCPLTVDAQGKPQCAPKPEPAKAP